MIMEYVRMKTKPTVKFLKIWYFSCRSLDVCVLVFFVCVKEVWKYVPNNFQSERCLLKCILFNFLFSSTSRLGKGDYTISDETLMESERLTWSSPFHRFFSFLFFFKSWEYNIPGFWLLAVEPRFLNPIAPAGVLLCNSVELVLTRLCISLFSTLLMRRNRRGE